MRARGGGGLEQIQVWLYMGLLLQRSLAGFMLFAINYRLLETINIALRLEFDRAVHNSVQLAGKVLGEHFLCTHFLVKTLSILSQVNESVICTMVSLKWPMKNYYLYDNM